MNKQQFFFQIEDVKTKIRAWHLNKFITDAQYQNLNKQLEVLTQGELNG